MTLTVTREELDALEPEWEELVLRLPEPVPFVHPAWQRVWLTEFANGREPYIYAVRDEGALVGVAPLLREDDRLTLVGHYSICDYMDVVVPPERTQAFLSALLGELANDSWTELELRGLRGDSPTLAELPAAAEAAGLTVEREKEAVAPRIELAESWEAFVASLSKKDRHELRRKLRRLEEAGEVEFRAYTTPEEVTIRLPTLLRFMVESRPDKAAFMTEQMGRFFHVMVEALSQKGLLRLFELELDRKTVASILCFDLGGQLMLYNSGYDPEYGQLGVGFASKALCIRDAIATGHRYVDMLRGHEPYKYRLGGEDRTIYRCVVRRA